MHVNEIKRNKTLSQFFRPATDSEMMSESVLLNSMHSEKRQKYKALRYQLDRAKADLAKISHKHTKARAEAEREIAIIENELRQLR